MVATIVFAVVAQVPDRYYTDNGHPDLLSAYEDDINRIVSARIIVYPQPYTPYHGFQAGVASLSLNLFNQVFNFIHVIVVDNKFHKSDSHITMIAGEIAKQHVRQEQFCLVEGIARQYLCPARQEPTKVNWALVREALDRCQ